LLLRHRAEIAYAIGQAPASMPAPAHHTQCLDCHKKPLRRECSLALARSSAKPPPLYERVLRLLRDWSSKDDPTIGDRCSWRRPNRPLRNPVPGVRPLEIERRLHCIRTNEAEQRLAQTAFARRRCKMSEMKPCLAVMKDPQPPSRKRGLRISVQVSRRA